MDANPSQSWSRSTVLRCYAVGRASEGRQAVRPAPTEIEDFGQTGCVGFITLTLRSCTLD